MSHDQEDCPVCRAIRMAKFVDPHRDFLVRKAADLCEEDTPNARLDGSVIALALDYVELLKHGPTHAHLEFLGGELVELSRQQAETLMRGLLSQLEQQNPGRN